MAELNEQDRSLAFAHVSSWLEGYAKAKDVNAGELTAQVGKLLTNGHEAKTTNDGRTKRGPYKPRSANPGPRGWGNMTAAERSAEMIHRQRVAKGLEPPRPRAKQRKRPMGGVA